MESHSGNSQLGEGKARDNGLDHSDIVCIGVTCIDHVSIVRRTADGWEECGVPLAQGGGLAATAAVAAARVGGDVELWAVVGDDYHGQMVKTELIRQGVKVDQIQTVLDGRTPTAFIEVDADTGERTIYYSPSRSVPPPEDQVSFDLGRVRQAKCVLVTGMWTNLSTAAARLARENGAKVVADLASTREALHELIAQVDALIMPEFADVVLEAGNDFGRALREMAALGPCMPVVTVGSKGSYYLADDRVYHCSAFKVRAVDTTGCGDSFHGAFAYSLSRGWDIHKSIRFSSAVAALKATKLGGRSGLPTLPEVTSFLEERADEGRAIRV